MATINQNDKIDYDALKISYTDKDYTNILDDLIESIPGISAKWETSDVNDPGMILVKLMAMLGDMLFYEQDMQTLEVFPNSVTQRKNAATIYRLIGYKMHWYRSASLIADVVNTYTESATIPRFCTFTTENRSITYTTFDSYDVASNTQNNGTVTRVELIQGIPVTPSRLTNNPYPETGKPWHSIYGYNYTLDDMIDNRIYLKDTNIDESHIILVDDQNEIWTLMDNVYLTTKVNRMFEFGVDSNDNTYLELVDYWKNYNVSKFKVFYIKSNGEEGQVYADTLTKVTGSVWSRITQNDTTMVSNVSSFLKWTHTASNYGYNPETPDEARINSPKYQNTLDTLITLADFERAVLRIPTVANVRATDLTNDPGEEVTHYLGDLNQDGVIDSKDVDLLTQYIQDKRLHPLTSYQEKLADVNQDGIIDELDLDCLKEFVSPTMYDIGDINMDGTISTADLTLLKDYVKNPSSVVVTDFQLRLMDVNQDGVIDNYDSIELEKYLNSTHKVKSPFGSINNELLVGETGKQGVSTVKTLDGFVVKLYVARKPEYDMDSEEYDDVYITSINDALEDYKILPLKIEIDLHSIKRYYWTIQGKFYTRQPLTRDELQTIIININNKLSKNYSIDKINFNSLVNYRDIINDILSVDNRILMVDLDPITYTDEEGNIIEKEQVTGEYKQTVPQIGIIDGVLQPGIEDKDRLKYVIQLGHAPILPGSILIQANTVSGSYNLKDNSNGQIYNDDNVLAKKGKIDYITGELELEFNSILIDDLIVNYTKNEAVLASYKNLSTQTFYFDSSCLQRDNLRLDLQV